MPLRAQQPSTFENNGDLLVIWFIAGPGIGRSHRGPSAGDRRFDMQYMADPGAPARPASIAIDQCGAAVCPRAGIGNAIGQQPSPRSGCALAGARGPSLGFTITAGKGRSVALLPGQPRLIRRGQKIAATGLSSTNAFLEKNPKTSFPTVPPVFQACQPGPVHP